MSLEHVWFDIDGTLYHTPEELEARIFNAMYKTVSRLLKISLEETIELYDTLYRNTESHTVTFSRLALPADEARKAYNSTDIATYLKEDSDLVRMFDFFSALEVPCSIYSNNYTRTIESVVQKLGIAKRFLFTIPGEFFPKGTDDTFKKTDEVSPNTETKKISGFRRIIELSNSHAGAELDPGDILFVGDREKLDIRPAKKYGMKTARVLWTPDVDSVKSTADYKLADIYQLSRIVESLARRERNKRLLY